MENSTSRCSCCNNAGQVACNHCFGQKNIWVGVSAACGTGWQRCTECGGTGKLSCPSQCDASKGRLLLSKLEVIRNQDQVQPLVDSQQAAVLYDD